VLFSVQLNKFVALVAIEAPQNHNKLNSTVFARTTDSSFRGILLNWWPLKWLDLVNLENPVLIGRSSKTPPKKLSIRLHNECFDTRNV
jgi:hypothetical protein